jgi:hypothetical protein
VVSIEDVQEALVTALKADAPLVVVVGDEIRESQWQGVDFTYPMVRVSMGSMVPWHPGTCANRLIRSKFSTLTFSENSSSLEANQIAKLVMTALHLESLNGTGWESGRIRLSPGGQSAAVRVSERVWRTETRYEVNIYGEA